MRSRCRNALFNPPQVSTIMRLSLSRKIRATATLLAIGALLALIAYWSNLLSTNARDKNAAIEHGGAHGRQLAESLSHHLSTLFDQTDLALQTLSGIRISGSPSQFEYAVQRTVENYPKGALAQIGIIDAEGYLAYTTSPNKSRVFLGDREHFRIHRQRGSDELFISAPLVGRSTNQWSIQFSRPLIREGRFSGVIVVSVATEYIAKAFGELQLEPTDVLAVINDKGVYLSRVPNNAGAMGKSIASDRPFLRDNAAHIGTFVDRGHFDGIWRIYSWASLDSYPATVVVGFDRDAMLARTEQAESDAIRRSAIGTFLFSMLAIAGIALLFRLANQQRKLGENEQRLQQIIDASLDALITVDESQRIVVFNVAAEKMFGCTAANVIGRPIDRFIPAALRAAHRDHILNFGVHLQTPRPMGKMNRVTGLRSDGTEFPIEVSLSRVVIDGKNLFTASIRDLSAAENARSALSDANMLTQEIISSAREGIIVYGTDLRYRLWNPYMERFTGMTAPEVLGRHPLEVFPFLANGGVIARIELALKGEVPDPVEFPFEVKETGASGWASDVTAPLRDSQGKVVGAIGTVRDITAVKDAEQRLRELNQELESRVSERTAELAIERDRADAANRAKSVFLANMSHEIRTPMTAILGMGELLRLEPLSPRQLERLDRMHDAAQHLLGILSDILDLSKIEAGKMPLEPVETDLRALAQGALEMIDDRARARGLMTEFECPDNLDHVMVDATRLRQALINYLSNAVKFTESGRVVLRVDVESEDATTLHLRFAVEDSGIGIAQDAMAGIFEQFHQIDSSTTREFGGTGLGLVIVRQIVTLMGGKVGVESEVGAGSTFWFTVSLPRANAVRDAAEVVVRQVSPADVAPILAPRAVLVADDEPANREVIAGMLESQGVVITIADNGAKAVDLASREKYDLILMDLHMPEMDGLEATRRIRRDGPNAQTPIIALTGDAITNVREECHRAGMNDFIAKPFRMGTLLEATGRWWT